MEFNATFIVAFISFVVFILIMNQILYKPIIEVVQNRKNYIKDNYTTAQNNEELKYKVLKEKDDKINETKQNSILEIKEAKNSLKSNKEEKIKAFKNSSLEEIKNKFEEISNEEKNANNELKNRIVDLAQIISDKFLKTDEKITVDNDLIERLMS